VGIWESQRLYHVEMPIVNRKKSASYAGIHEAVALPVLKAALNLSQLRAPKEEGSRKEEELLIRPLIWT